MHYTTSIGVRYALFATHAVLIVSAALVTQLLQPDLIGLCMFPLSGLMWLIYVPPALVFTAKRRSVNWTCAGAEVAYLVLQMADTLGLCITYSIFYAVYELDRFEYDYGTWNFYVATITLTAIHFVMLTSWMIWDICLVYRYAARTRMTVNQAFNELSVYELYDGAQAVPQKLPDAYPIGEV